MDVLWKRSDDTGYQDTHPLQPQLTNDFQPPASSLHCNGRRRMSTRTFVSAMDDGHDGALSTYPPTTDSTPRWPSTTATIVPKNSTAIAPSWAAFFYAINPVDRYFISRGYVLRPYAHQSVNQDCAWHHHWLIRLCTSRLLSLSATDAHPTLLNRPVKGRCHLAPHAHIPSHMRRGRGTYIRRMLTPT